MLSKSSTFASFPFKSNSQPSSQQSPDFKKNTPEDAEQKGMESDDRSQQNEEKATAHGKPSFRGQLLKIPTFFHTPHSVHESMQQMKDGLQHAPDDVKVRGTLIVVFLLFAYNVFIADF
jgi:hypothetical protein